MAAKLHGQASREPKMPVWIEQIPEQVAKRGADRAAWYVHWHEPDGDDRRWRKSCGGGEEGKARATRKAAKVDTLARDGRIEEAEMQFGQPSSDSHCRDCGVNTTGVNGEYYMVQDAIWKQAKMHRNGGMLCIGCLERRIGRRLTKLDFKVAPVNDGDRCSDRMRDRLGIAD
jgi:hypothetical protein